MKFGISFLPDCSNKSKAAKIYFDDAINLSIFADQEGLNTVKITEHYLNQYGGYCPSPLIFLSAVARSTKQIRLMTGCSLPVFHHPIQIAAEIALLDVISNGRLDIGFARGFLPYEYNSFGISIDESRERYQYTINAIIKLWTQANVSINTPFFSFKNANSLPNCLQLPHPPIWIAGAMSRQTFAWAGENNFNLLVALTIQRIKDLKEEIEIYKESLNKRKIRKITILIPLFLDNNFHDAINMGKFYLERYHKVWVAAAKAWDNLTSDNYPKYRGIAKKIEACDFDYLIKNKNLAFGDPKSLIDYIQMIKNELGVDQILWNIDYGSMPLELSKQSLRLFVEKVLPFT